MENQQKNIENLAYRVYDEMGCEDLLLATLMKPEVLLIITNVYYLTI